MCFGIWKDHLILRLGEPGAHRAFKNKAVKPFDITDRAMKGWVMVAPADNIGGRSDEVDFDHNSAIAV
jgi:hypothetical protein